MFSSSTWQNLLANPRSGDHYIQLYDEDQFLFETVGHFIATGLKAGRPGILIATPAHLGGFRATLEEKNIDVARAEKEARLVLLDAAQTLSRFLVNGYPKPEPFNAVVGGVVERVSRGATVELCAYGEMVNLLFQKGDRPQARILEDLWNTLARKYPFTLLCAYKVDTFEQGVLSTLMEITCSHSHLIPVRDYERLEKALDRALEEELGRDGLALRSILEAYPPRLPHMPPAQAALVWLQQSLPMIAEPVVARVRELYRAAGEIPVKAR